MEQKRIKGRSFREGQCGYDDRESINEISEAVVDRFLTNEKSETNSPYPHHPCLSFSCKYLFSNLRDKFGYDTWILSFRGNDELINLIINSLKCKSQP